MCKTRDCGRERGRLRGKPNQCTRLNGLHFTSHIFNGIAICFYEGGFDFIHVVKLQHLTTRRNKNGYLRSVIVEFPYPVFIRVGVLFAIIK